MDVVLHFVSYSLLTNAQLPCQRPHGPPRIPVDELLEGGHCVVIQGVTPPSVALSLRAELFWQTSASDKFVVTLFEAFHSTFGDVIKRNDLRNCPSPTQATEDGGPRRLLSVHADRLVAAAVVTSKIM